MAIIGIDLGTTNSLCAAVRDGEVVLIPNRFGSYLTPSVVSVDGEGNIEVGEIAKERMVTHPEDTAFSFKRDMGTEKKWKLGRRTFTPEELSSFVLRSIFDDARAFLGEEIEEAVISVPAYFHDKQRVATKRAGLLAGIPVKRIINEPSAAALASYVETGEEKLYCVFDFGGGTLDISIVDCFDTMVEIVSVAGNNRLGGDDFNRLIAEAFLRDHGIKKSAIGRREFAILIRAAEKCKIALTDQDPAEMTVTLNDRTFTSTFTNERLMELSGDLFGKIKDALARALKGGSFRASEIDAIVMAGGSSRMPLVQSFVQHLFGGKPIILSNPDELIARGLGTVCGIMSRSGEVKDYVMADICPFTLGTQTHNKADSSNPFMTPIISRNTALPCSRSQRFFTSSDNQSLVSIQILQGEHPYAKDDLKLGEIEVPVPKGPAGKESVDVRFTYDIDGILIADVKVTSTGLAVSKVISDELTGEQLEKRISELNALKLEPKEEAENKVLIEKLEALFEEAEPDLRETVQNRLKTFLALLEKQNERKIRKYREYLVQFLDRTELDDPFDSIFDTELPEEEPEEEETWGGADFFRSDGNDPFGGKGGSWMS